MLLQSPPSEKQGVLTPQSLHELERYFPILFALGVTQLTVVIWASVRYRRSRGKPIIFRDVPDARFIDKSASGYSHRTWFTRLGGARRCLIVAVTHGRLIIRPFFPFNMMFLPEIYGLEYEVPLNQITHAERGRGSSFLGSSVRLRFRDTDGTEQDVTVYLRDPRAFLDAIKVSPAARAVKMLT